jgi:hypothetical protein
VHVHLITGDVLLDATVYLGEGPEVTIGYHQNFLHNPPHKETPTLVVGEELCYVKFDFSITIESKATGLVPVVVYLLGSFPTI